MSFGANALAASTLVRWFNPWNGGRSTQLDGTITDKLPIVVPLGGTLKNFRVGCLTSPSAGSGNAVYTLVKNGVDTGIVITIPLTGAHVGTSAGTLAVVAGDVLTLKVQCSVSPTAGSAITFAFELEVAGTGMLLHFGMDSHIATAGTRFMAPWFAGSTPSTTERPLVVQRPGTIDKLYVVGTTGSIASLHTYTLRKNAADTSLVASLNDNASPYAASDLSNSVSVVKGDAIALKIVTAGASSSAARIAVAARFVPSS